jgi:hypothetical protein
VLMPLEKEVLIGVKRPGRSGFPAGTTIRFS